MKSFLEEPPKILQGNPIRRRIPNGIDVNVFRDVQPAELRQFGLPQGRRAIVFVGRLHPAGIVLAGILLSMMLIGGELGQSRLGLPNALSSVFQGLLLVLLLACDTLIHYRLRLGSALARARA